MESFDILTTGIREWPVYFKVSKLWKVSSLLALYNLFRFPSWDIWMQTHNIPRPSEDFRFGETPYMTGLKIIKMAKITESDVFYDLGAGRGKMTFLTALATGCRAVGLEFLASYTLIANRIIRQLHLEGQAELRHADILKENLGEATVLYTAASSWSATTRERMLERVPELASGTRWISVGWELRHPQLELISAQRLLFSWGYDNAWLYVVKDA